MKASRHVFTDIAVCLPSTRGSEWVPGIGVTSCTGEGPQRRRPKRRGHVGVDGRQVWRRGIPRLWQRRHPAPEPSTGLAGAPMGRQSRSRPAPSSSLAPHTGGECSGGLGRAPGRSCCGGRELQRRRVPRALRDLGNRGLGRADARPTRRGQRLARWQRTVGRAALTAGPPHRQCDEPRTVCGVEPGSPGRRRTVGPVPQPRRRDLAGRSRRVREGRREAPGRRVARRP